MKKPGETLAISAPPQVGAGVERSRRRALEARRPADPEQSAEDGSDRLLEHRQRRFALATPHLLIGIREQRSDDVAETRARVEAVFVGELFRSDFNLGHLSPRPELYTGPRARGRAGANARRTRRSNFIPTCAIRHPNNSESGDVLGRPPLG